jgi:hypothetical protein
MYYRQHYTENYKKMYEIWRQRNPECGMNMDAKKQLHQNSCSTMFPRDMVCLNSIKILCIKEIPRMMMMMIIIIIIIIIIYSTPK